VRCKNFTFTKSQAHPSRFNSFLAFTLIEIVTVIAIIAIVLKIALATYGSIRQSAQKLEDQSKLKKIAAAWYAHTVENNFGPIPSGKLVHHYLAGGIAGQGWHRERCFINDPYAYISSGDKYASKVNKSKSTICGPSGNQGGYLDPYERRVNAITSSSSPISLSYCMVAGLSKSVPLDTTPIAFSRGLMSSGKWHPKYGLYGEKGGWVAFADGHVKWCDGARPAKFLKWNGTGYSNDIREALPSSAAIKSGHNMNSNIKEGEDILIISHGCSGGE
jgi:type II secretory pathway pseudopilin PulG